MYLKSGNVPKNPFSTRAEGSLWFRRLKKEAQRLSPYLRFRRINHGFYRVYWREAYIHELYKEMPLKGYDFEDYDPRFENRSYYEEYEDKAELTRRIKNFKEGYWDSKDTIWTRMYLMRNDEAYATQAKKSYKQMRIY